MKIKDEYKGYTIAIGKDIAEATNLTSFVKKYGQLTKKELVALRNLNIITSDKVEVSKNDTK